MIIPFPIFIGWDRREPIAYEVAKFSLERRASIPVDVRPIKLDELQQQKMYWREQDPLASTEFTYSRFLTPKLANYRGWALFCDCDFLFLSDIAELASYAKGNKAVYCVQHDYRPSETTKMDGAVQTVYPRKNWSSLMLFNCEHPSVRVLTPEIVNRETAAYLHRMQWAADNDIGALPVEWNWLEGWNKKPTNGTPNAIHFTRGGPWFEHWQNVEYGSLWLAERAMLDSGKR
jgi:lipopolysaccharide biosynthesis glycosyltransferase